MGSFKSGFVCLVGRTNSGKSTLMNALANEKVAIVTPKTQTTRNAIKAIVNTDNAQIIFVDTPGIHKGSSKLSKTMVEISLNKVGEVDCVLFLVEATEKKEISAENLSIIATLKKYKKPCILIINKADLVPRTTILDIIDRYKDEYDFEAVIPISATKRQGLDIVIEEIEKILPEGPRLYEDDIYTDQTMRSMAEEIIREKALKLLNDEVPHGIYVEIDKFSERTTTKGKDIYDIDATIYCLRESHKGIIIGKDGAMLKKISTYARKDIEEMTGTKVNLRIWVKVKNNWINNESLINSKFKQS